MCSETQTISTSNGTQNMTSTDVILFIDCDDTIYQNDWGLANLITKNIENYATQILGLPNGMAYELYKKHGTCLRGLQKEKIPFDVEDFLEKVHNIPLADFLSRDENLQEMLGRLKPEIKRCIYTASTEKHARECVRLVGLTDFFQDAPIIDSRKVSFYTKHDKEAHQIAMNIMKTKEPHKCILVDDSKMNISTAKSMGWITVLIGTTGRHGEDQRGFPDADYVIDKLSELENILPHLFLKDACLIE